MVRKLLFSLPLIAAPLLSACSYRSDFVIINKADSAIEVRYQLKRWTPETPGKFVDFNPPAKLTVGEFQKSGHHWQQLSKTQYGFDNLTGTFTVSVAADEVLLVDFAYNYRGDDDEFDLAAIHITGAKGSVDLQGHQAQTQFKVESDRRYVLRYQ